MRIDKTEPVRAFTVGLHGDVELKEVAKIGLAPGEMVTFVTAMGSEYDVTRTPWGYYATPSLNGRLLEKGFRAVMVQNTQGRRFVLLVERGEEAENLFADYCVSERLNVLGWLDGEKVITGELIEACLCGIEAWAPLFHYDAPPPGETRFEDLGQAYQRDFVQCQHCGHCHAVHNLPFGQLYEKHYMTATYGSGLRASYDRIMALPAEQSDNVGRVAWLTHHLGIGAGRPVLDVGSGLGVFLARMKEVGWVGTALDPDAGAVAHAHDVVGVKGIQADWLAAPVSAEKYHLVTFNKVVEHIVEPIEFMRKSKDFLAPGGHVYVEVPDGEIAAKEGAGREEFFVEHWHAFSPLSLLFLLRQAGLQVLAMERLHEPSGKFTLRALASPV